MVLTKMFEEVIDPIFHYGSRGLDTKGFGTTPPVDILENLQHLYGKPSYQELDAALLHLNKSMNRMQPAEVILRVIEEVQLLPLANPDKDRTLIETNLISYALIKLTKPGVCMPKASRGGKRDHRRIGKNGPNSWTTW